MTEFEKWLKDRPQCIKDLAAKYPPGQYRMKEDAPYGVSCEHTEVTLCSYMESGHVGIIVEAKNKLPRAICHEITLARKYNKLDQLEEFHAKDVNVEIDPKWMTLIKPE